MDVTPLVEKGAVVFNEHMENRNGFLSELLSFPSSKHDDWIDAFTLALHKRFDMLRVANQFRREKRKHLPRASTMRVELYSFG